MGEDRNDTVVKLKRNAKPGFELSTDSSKRDRQHSIPARGRSARNAREFNFAKCYNKAGYIILHGGAVGKTSRTGRSKLEARKLRTAAHSMRQTGWMTSKTESAEPGAAAIDHLSEWPAQEWRSTVHSTHQTV